MSKHKEVVVDCDGQIWRLSKRSYLKVLTAIAEGQDYDLRELKGQLIHSSYCTLWDLEPEDAKEMLVELDKNKEI